MTWGDGLAEWIEGNTAFISIAFSWRADDAYMRCSWLSAEGYKVRIGGPGLVDRKVRSMFDGIAEYGGEAEAIIHHNPEATIASRGCPVGCYFCIVPRIEGTKFTLLPDFTPRPILCDNNVSALPNDYQDYIIEKYKKHNVKLQDINSGFEPRTFTEQTYHRWKEINKGAWRFAFDEIDEEIEAKRTAEILHKESASRKRVYVLIGNEPKEQCLYRVNRVIEWGCEPHVQPMIALGAREKKPIIKFDWTEQELRNMARWANRWIWRTVKFEDYKSNIRSAKTA